MNLKIFGVAIQCNGIGPISLNLNCIGTLSFRPFDDSKRRVQGAVWFADISAITYGGCSMPIARPRIRISGSLLKKFLTR